jgi:hypothetical protein
MGYGRRERQGAYAPHIRKNPLGGMAVRPLIIQFSQGDYTVPNPTTMALIRAGDFAGLTTFFRTDHAFTLTHVRFLPRLPADPHTFLGRLDLPLNLALSSQDQIASLFASDGADFIDPVINDVLEDLFESPIVSNFLAETLVFFVP